MSIRNLSLPLRVIFLCLFGGASASAGNWPGFRGPEQSGVAAEGARPPIHFGPTSNLLWNAELPRGHSSPVIWDDSLFVTASREKVLITRCLDRLTGKLRWEQSVRVEKLEKIHKVNSIATPTPTTDGKAVFVYFGCFGLLAYDFEGRELWRKPLPMPQTMMDQGTGTSPILAGDKLILFVQTGTNSHLLAVNPTDGRELWKGPMPEFNFSYATPICWKEGDHAFVGMSRLFRFSAFDLSNGKEAWWVEGTGAEPCSTPVAAGNRLVIVAAGIQGEPSNMTLPPSFDDFVAQYDTNHDGLIALEEIPDDLLFTDRKTSDGQGNMSLKRAFELFTGAEFKKGDRLDRKKWDELRGNLSEFATNDIANAVVLGVRTGGTANATKSHVSWRLTKGVPEAPSPLVWRGHVYLVRNGGLLARRDLETGNLIQELKTESRGGYFASPVLADGLIYIASDRGTVTVVRAEGTLEVVARNELREPIFASPAVVGDTLYLRSTSHLWAFAAPAK